MPLNLDSCITGIFVPGNIGASSGQPPIIRVMPPRVPDIFEVQVNEVTTAIAVASILGDVGSTVIETAAAVDAVYFSQIHDVVVGEAAPATDAASVDESGVISADLTEAATAADALDGTVVAFPRSAMLDSVFVNSDGTLRNANANGVMVNQ